MKFKKISAMVAAVCLVGVVGLAGCSQGGSADKAADAGKDAAAPYTLQTPGTLTIATSPDFPPFENLVNGEYVGLDIEVGKAIAKKLGLEPKFVSLQFDAILPAISAGTKADVGISGFTVDPEREKQVDFSTPYYTDDLSVAVLKSSSITSDNADAELNKEGVKIAVQSGTSGESYVKEHYPNATVVPYGNSNDCFAAMEAAQVNAVCTNYAVVGKMLSEAYTDAQVVKSVPTGEDYAVAASKDNPELTKAVNNALKELKADGTIDALLKQYL
ncbi:amino acid ABC transporter substrate-binding protein [Berryella wangjianweii]|uniref:Amino acid ABC transporter substrate-binding protein n=1 Tax=Berryella wangjianweii TaxID=2734634 RepID=A0A6M8J1K6_9ACTN|nr:ABC transporter substrate-binding protein [Berryella wangjianweii]QKF07820.1 amino acid ABC transporter substrate-binding protein [Berryella wangjianweii]